MFAHMSEGIKKPTITAFRSYVGSSVIGSQVFKFCMTEGQHVNKKTCCSNKILFISNPG